MMPNRSVVAGVHFGTSLVLAALLALAGCGAPSSARPEARSETATAAAPTRLVAAVKSDPAGLHLHLTQPSQPVVPGLAQIYQLVNAALATADDQDAMQPQLAEAVPSVENGLWKVLPDGRMETTWRIKPGAVWHDGAPFDADDLLFSYRVFQDRELPIFHLGALDLVESVQAVDPRTVVVTWQRPFIEADTMFSSALIMPLPRHLLEPTFDDDRTSLLSLPYWRGEFVGTGPYRVVDWIPGSHLLLSANDRYVLGKPRLSEIEIRFLTDFNTITANLMAGSIEMLLGTQLLAEQALTVRDSAPTLNVVLAPRLGGVLPLYPQHLNPTPAVVANAVFRRALLQAINRVEMNDAINHGIGPIAHTWLQPDRPEYVAVAPQIVQYAYDPREAERTIAGLGYTKGTDNLLRDADGQQLAIEIRTTDQEILHVPSALAVADYWSRLGIAAEVNTLPQLRLTDRPYLATYPAFHMTTGGQGLESSAMLRWRSSQTPVPENQFAGQNRGRYQNPVLDGLVERYAGTIPRAERLQVLGQILHLQTDQLTMLPLFYRADGVILGPKRLKNVTGPNVWNVHLWAME
jgi:peptide/nickel transport system substrate-binding protein